MNRLVVPFLGLAVLAVPLAAQQRPPAAQPEAPQARTQDPVEQKKPARLELGKRLPKAIALPDIDGQVHRSQQFAGKVVVVNFWSITCPIMKGWESRLAAIHADYAAKDVVFLMVNSNEGNGEIGDGVPAHQDEKAGQDEQAEKAKPYQKIRSYLAEHELPYTVLVDRQSEVADLFQAKTTPDVFVFDTAGVLVYRGLIDDDPRGNKGEKTTHHLKTVLDALLAGEEVEPKETKPIGCSIKRPAKQQRAERGQ